jgi:asparagine synthase (glutamine-hydrolysing)
MCGIAGIFGAAAGTDYRRMLLDMTAALRHRGPDDGGTWIDEHAGVGLGHRRLSIVDLSAAGHQPMRSGSGQFVIAFNGEIYNHEELRAALGRAGAAPAWRGHSDTETLLAGFEHWGIEPTLRRALGMFAFALWDSKDRRLYLARDRFGEKPLYFGWADGAGSRVFLFGSELKALRAFPGFRNPICREALVQYMRFLSVPAPRSIYRDVFKLEPGCLLTISETAPIAPPPQPLRPPANFESLTLSRWWSLSEVVRNGAAHMIHDDGEAVRLVEEHVLRAVKLQSLADVPLGAFLSGGVDSSAVVALMQQQSTARVKTFTIGFQEEAFDESSQARAVAEHLRTEHTEIFVSAADARAVIPQLPSMYDEPFADSSQIPTHLVCRAARQEVTVALSGDGGDEMFGGYNRHVWGPRIWQRFGWLPHPIRRAMGAAVLSVPVGAWDAVERPVNAVFGRRASIAQLGDKAHKLAHRLSRASSVDDLYLGLVSAWHDPASVVRSETGAYVEEPPSSLSDFLPADGVDESALLMMYQDSTTYLSDDIMCKVDRASMAVSLETRAPFLDRDVAELVWRLPLRTKIRDGQGKWVLRQVLYKYVPRELIDRPKTGFSIPIGDWLRGPLRAWAEDLLNEQRLEREGYFRPKPIRQRWRLHLSGSQDFTASLWAVLMFQCWLEALN